MFDALAYVLSFIVQPCYNITGNWWIAILLFTIIIKVILLPMSLWCQKNSIVMVQLMPDLNRIKIKYFGDREAIGESQHALYKEKHYHPLLSLVPLVIQIIILFGLVDVIHGITDGGAPGTAFLGMVPWTNGSLSWIMPVLAGFSAVIMGFAQNRINPLQKEQSRAEKNMTNGLSIGLSFVLGVFVATGMGFYWICSNLTSIAIQALCNIMIKPEKYIDYDDLAKSRTELEALNALSTKRTKWYRRDPLAKREKIDYKRFFNVLNKHIVFFSEGNSFYRYFQGAIEWLLAHSDAIIHYVTNDPDDQIFEIAKSEPRIRAYYIGPKRIITLMMKMDADIVVTTLEDLENYYIKRSYIRKDIEYVFMFHHMTSTHMTPHKAAFDHYDTLLCVGQHQIDEIRRAEELYGTPKKKLVPCGYGLLDRETAAYVESLPEPRTADCGRDDGQGDDVKEGGPRKTVLIAPSWQEGCIPDSCADTIIDELLGKGYQIIVRPHPEYLKRYRARWDALVSRYVQVPEDELYFEPDNSSTKTVFSADILITDWSSIFCEFSFSTKKPTVFIDTPMKVANPDYVELGMEPTDISLRNEVGVSIPLDRLERLPGVVSEMLEHSDEWHDRIDDVVKRMIFNPGHGDEAAGEYLLSEIITRQEKKTVPDAQA